mmetsp:Transcript_82974/g.231504  ORF Transcript_82974/g.231504 Transcript_82974/m.231504 type:complete len:178 (-) Transcript_82974:104-637(-)
MTLSLKGSGREVVNDEDPMPRLRALIPRSLSDLLRSAVDFLEVEGEAPMATASADWTWSLVGPDGVACPSAPVVFDPKNVSGAERWGADAQGAIVVAQRGTCSFQAMVRCAEDAGAAALVVVDNSEVWEGRIQMSLETGVAGFYLVPPRLPAVLVPRHAGELLCRERSGLRARIIRR